MHKDINTPLQNINSPLYQVIHWTNYRKNQQEPRVVGRFKTLKQAEQCCKKWKQFKPGDPNNDGYDMFSVQQKTRQLFQLPLQKKQNIEQQRDSLRKKRKQMQRDWWNERRKQRQRDQLNERLKKHKKRIRKEQK